MWPVNWAPKVVLLAGGLGTRIGEETQTKPKPMVEIGGWPIIWHIMKSYGDFGYTDFVICLGYKGYVIKEYFANYFLHMSDVTIDLTANSIEVHRRRAEPWRITLLDTGADTMTGGRIKRVREYVEQDPYFLLTYGDGVADVNLAELVKFHEGHGKKVSMTAVVPPGRFGALDLDGRRVVEFKEKPAGDGALINGGFFVVDPCALDEVQDDTIAWEAQPLEKLAHQGELMAYEHNGFWHPMDTLRDCNYLNRLFEAGEAPWVTWA